MELESVRPTPEQEELKKEVDKYKQLYWSAQSDYNRECRRNQTFFGQWSDRQDELNRQNKLLKGYNEAQKEQIQKLQKDLNELKREIQEKKYEVNRLKYNKK